MLPLSEINFKIICRDRAYVTPSCKWTPSQNEKRSHDLPIRNTRRNDLAWGHIAGDSRINIHPFVWLETDQYSEGNKNADINSKR